MFIYKITNLINNKIYIGKTIRSIKIRFYGHIAAANYGADTYIANAFRKYGKNNFKIEEIDTANSHEELRRKEFYWIKQYNSQNHKIGYNILSGNESGEIEYSFETIKKSIKSRKDKKRINKGRRKSKYFGVLKLEQGRRGWGFQVLIGNYEKREYNYRGEINAAFARDIFLVKNFKKKDILEILNFPEKYNDYKNNKIIPLKYKKMQKEKESKYKNVRFAKEWNLWGASININKKNIQVAYFRKEKMAAEMADWIKYKNGFLNQKDFNFDIEKYKNPNYEPPKTITQQKQSKIPEFIYKYKTRMSKQIRFRVRNKDRNVDKSFKSLDLAIEYKKSLNL